MITNNAKIEKELLSKVAAGHEASFKLLFNMYNERLLSYIFGMIKSREVAEEVVMDVFLKIWLGRDLITQIDNFDAFLFRVAHNRSIDFLRSVARDPKFRDMLWEELQLSGSDQADAPMLNKEFESKLREAVSLLSVQRKKVYQLSRNEDMSQEEIAQHLGLSRNTVNNHIVEARRFIRAYLAKNLDIALFFTLFVSNALKN